MERTATLARAVTLRATLKHIVDERADPKRMGLLRQPRAFQLQDDATFSNLVSGVLRGLRDEM